MTISLPEKISLRFGDSIAHLILGVLDPINQHYEAGGDQIEIDVSPCEFITPLTATALAVLHNRFNSLNQKFTIRCDDGAPFSDYSKLIYFPVGMMPEKVESGDYDSALSKYSKKTYVPLLNFPAQLTKNDSQVRDAILQALHNLLNTQLKLPNNFKIGVTYLIDELVNNVKDHSKAQRGFIFAQYYKTGKYLDVCIADNGIGILDSYHNHGIIDIMSHAQAIRHAVNGKSTKNEFGGRGFGISTSIKMLVEGMKGSFLLMSGDAHIIRNSGKVDINEMPSPINWQGTLVSLRIPFTEKEFNYQNYLE